MSVIEVFPFIQKSALAQQQRLVRRARQLHAVNLQSQLVQLWQSNLALQRQLKHPDRDSSWTLIRVPSKIAARVQANARSLELHQLDCDAAQLDINYARNATADKTSLLQHRLANKGKHDKLFSDPWWEEGKVAEADPWLQPVGASLISHTAAKVDKSIDTSIDVWAGFSFNPSHAPQEVQRFEKDIAALIKKEVDKNMADGVRNEPCDVLGMLAEPSPICAAGSSLLSGSVAADVATDSDLVLNRIIAERLSSFHVVQKVIGECRDDCWKLQHDDIVYMDDDPRPLRVFRLGYGDYERKVRVAQLFENTLEWSCGMWVSTDKLYELELHDSLMSTLPKR